jgi:hypothetical protein
VLLFVREEQARASMQIEAVLADFAAIRNAVEVNEVGLRAERVEPRSAEVMQVEPAGDEVKGTVEPGSISTCAGSPLLARTEILRAWPSFVMSL